MPTPLCASAISTESDSTGAAREVSGRLREALAGRDVDLLLFFMSPSHSDEAEAVAGELSDALSPGVLAGGTAGGVLAADREVESGACIAAMAASLPDTVVTASRLTFQVDDREATITGFPFPVLRDDPEAGALVFADPFSIPVDALLRVVNERLPGVPLSGGLLSAGSFPGSNRVILDGEVSTEGGVVITVSGRCTLRALVSQGCRPVGRHFVITRGHDNVIEELGGKPAIERLQEVLGDVPYDDRERMQSALHIGRVIDEYKSEFARGDFLVRSVVHLDPSNGSIAISDFVRRGQTVQFHVRDPESAHQDLDVALQEERAFLSERPPAGVLLFTCNGRGRRMFQEPHHDARLVTERIEGVPVAGFFAAGEIGPVGRQNFLHGFSASVSIFCDSRPAHSPPTDS